MDLKKLDFYKLAIILLFIMFIATNYQNRNEKNNRYIRPEYGGAFDTQKGILLYTEGDSTITSVNYVDRIIETFEVTKK